MNFFKNLNKQNIARQPFMNMVYYELSLLRTYGHFVQSRRHNFIVLTLVITDSERNFLTLAKQKQVSRDRSLSAITCCGKERELVG